MDCFCSKCKVAIKPDEFNYSNKNYGKPLCREHQSLFFKENLIKGRIAETLIEELFLHFDYLVFRYGMENTIPGVMKLLKNDRSPAAQNIRRMPDLVIQHNKTHKVDFIEVKFRSSEKFDKFDSDFTKHDETFKEYPYKKCFFIIVSKKHIKCITYEELERNEKITPGRESDKYYLANREEFELNKKVIIDFCDFAVKFFESV